MSTLLPKALCDINRLYFNAGKCTGVLKNENKQNNKDGEDEVVLVRS